jgi:hypothetical protein
MDQLTLGIGTRLQHTQFGPGVIVGVKYAVYLISFIHHGVKEIDKSDPHLDEIIPENVTEEIETHSETEKSLLKILRLWNGMSEVVPISDKWRGGTLSLQAADKSIKPKEIPIDIFFHKIVMARDRLRVLEQQINGHKGLSEEDKINLQQYITRIYGSFTTFNVLFRNKEQWFIGEKGSGE